MGKIKQKLIRRTAKGISEKGIQFETDFVKNKKILGKTMPSKKVRNQMAGLMSRIKVQELQKKAMLE